MIFEIQNYDFSLVLECTISLKQRVRFDLKPLNIEIKKISNKLSSCA